jgi:thioesterase domain-containing protein
LARAIGNEQPFYALTPFGLHGERVPETIEAMAAAYLEAMRQVQPKGPYLLGGFCNGGVIAFEMARQLENQGEQVALLALIAATAWNTRFRMLHALIEGVGKRLRQGAEDRARRFQAWRSRLQRLQRLSREGLKEQTAFAIHLLKKAFKRIALLSDGRKPSGSAGGSQADELYESHHRLLGRYMPGRYRGRVTLLWPTAQVPKYRDDSTMGWGRAAEQVEVHQVPGNHLSAVTSHVTALGERLKACLEEVQTTLSEQHESR